LHIALALIILLGLQLRCNEIVDGSHRNFDRSANPDAWQLAVSNHALHGPGRDATELFGGFV
jgi:hypothetical protein